MSFPNSVQEKALIACARCCCVCHKFCGTKIEIHHIELHSEGGKDTLDNAIALCFDCHADMRSYDSKHPKGTKYSANELIRHRDNWYKKVKNSSGLIRPSEAIATDKEIYTRLAKILPWNGSILFIRHNNFAGFAFYTDSLKNLANFTYQCDDPAFEFIDPDLEGLRSSLCKNIVKFMITIENETFPTNNPDRNSVPQEWEFKQPQRFKDVVESLHHEAQAICDSYDALTKLAVRKLGITANSK